MALSSASGAAQVNHLLLSEIGMNGGPNNEGEYIEIYNPTPSAVDLSNYWITDSNLYKTLPADADGLLALGTTDNIVRFPAGATLQSGQVAVVVGDADSFIESYFGSELNNFTGQPNSPLLFEVGGTTDTVANMEARNNNATTPLNFNFTNAGATNGEFAILFYWDGVSDLVKDVDIVGWGAPPNNANAFLPKKTTDLGKNGTPYLNDAGGHNENLSLGQVPIAVRVSIIEDSEVQNGGNGLTGHDESTEKSSESWMGGLFPADMSPGVTRLKTVLENQTPLITAVERDLQYPSSTQAVKITMNARDFDGTIASAEVFVDTGSGYNSVPASAVGANTFEATLMPMASGTLVKYYALVTDNGGATATLPLAGADGAKSFLVDDNPVGPGDVVINEILYDNPGSDTYEFVELRNTLDQPVSLAHFRFADLNRNWFRFPEDAEIPANGFAVVTLGLEDFTDIYGQQPNVQYYDWGTFALNNSAPGDTIFLVHPNDFDFNGVTSNLDIVQYDIAAPWPEGALGSGQSIELKNPTLDNNVAANWVVSAPAPTPGLDNTAYSTVLITDFNRDQAFPAPNTPVVVSAKVVSLTEATIQSVTLYVDSGTGFAATPMALSSTPDVYSVQIGGYPQDAVVKYYIQVQNSTGDISRLPVTAPNDFNVFIVDLDPVSSGDVVINEILYDVFNSDTNSYEFIELYNNTDEAIDLSYFRVMDNQQIPFVFPQGATIAPNSYVVLTMNSFAFRAAYGTPTVPLYDWESRFGLANGGDTIYLIHPNLFSFTGASVPLESVSYQVTAPWPNWTVPENHPNVTGRSIELIHPNYTDRYTNGERWAWTTNVVVNQPPDSVVQGTPGAQNSVYSNASVANWSLY